MDSRLGSWRTRGRRAALSFNRLSGPGSVVDCCCAAAAAAQGRPGRSSARPGVGGGGAASAAWCHGRWAADGPAGTARQGGPRQVRVTMGLVGSYVHTHSVLHLSRVYSARHARLIMWRAREERHLTRIMRSMSRLSCARAGGPGPIDSESGSSFTARQAAFKFEPPG
jgi:hypothetical protein